MKRQPSAFSISTPENVAGTAPVEVNERRLSSAIEGLLEETSNMVETDQVQMAGLMKRFTENAGVALGDSMDVALERLEQGDDPDRVEKEMAKFSHSVGCSQEKSSTTVTSHVVTRDETLYTM